jgi:hypothetical protein
MRKELKRWTRENETGHDGEVSVVPWRQAVTDWSSPWLSCSGASATPPADKHLFPLFFPVFFFICPFPHVAAISIFHLVLATIFICFSFQVFLQNGWCKQRRYAVSHLCVIQYSPLTHLLPRRQGQAFEGCQEGEEGPR